MLVSALRYVLLRKTCTQVSIYPGVILIHFFHVKSRIGSGRISACGGNGLAGGGGGRVSVDIFSRHDDPKVLVHGEIALFFFYILLFLFW